LVIIAFSTEDGGNVDDVRIFAISTCAWCNEMKGLPFENRVKRHYFDMDLVDEV